MFRDFVWYFSYIRDVSCVPGLLNEIRGYIMYSVLL